MDDVQELYAKKFQAIHDSYERITGKLSDEYSKRRIDIENAKNAALEGIPYRLHETNPEAYSNAVNLVYRAYGEKLQKWQDEWIRDLNRITTIHEHNKRQLADSYNRSYQEYERTNRQLNDASSEKLKNLSQATLNSTNPVVPRITTISSVR